MLSFTCSECATPMRAPETLSGRRVRCRKCGHKLRVPVIPGSAEDPNDDTAPLDAPSAFDAFGHRMAIASSLLLAVLLPFGRDLSFAVVFSLLAGVVVAALGAIERALAGRKRGEVSGSAAAFAVGTAFMSFFVILYMKAPPGKSAVVAPVVAAAIAFGWPCACFVFFRVLSFRNRGLEMLAAAGATLVLQLAVFSVVGVPFPLSLIGMVLAAPFLVLPTLSEIIVARIVRRAPEG